jgi:anion-transporting  ArsA/GET3 family ATPase
VTRLLALRDKLSGAGALLGTAAAAMRTVFGGGGGRAAPPPPAAAADGAALGLTAFRLQMRELSAILHDPLRAQFCIVAIPTELALLESTRLLLALRADGVAVRHLVLNRIVNADGDGGAQFVARLAAAHGKAAARAAALGEATGVDLTPVPYFDTEVVGLPGLRALGASLFRSV